MSDDHRATAREMAAVYIGRGDPLGWFEKLYAEADEAASIIPWVEFEPNPNLVDWLDTMRLDCSGLALKVGSGLGDDAEELSKRGFKTTAFDVSQTAVSWSRNRFPGSSVSYVAADLFDPPDEWRGKFDLVVESYTLQVLPQALHAEAIRCIASFVAPGGTLLVIARGREPEESEGKMPWPVVKDELAQFRKYGLKEISFDDFIDDEDPPVRRFRVTYRRG